MTFELLQPPSKAMLLPIRRNCNPLGLLHYNWLPRLSAVACLFGLACAGEGKDSLASSSIDESMSTFEGGTPPVGLPTSTAPTPPGQETTDSNPSPPAQTIEEDGTSEQTAIIEAAVNTAAQLDTAGTDAGVEPPADEPQVLEPEVVPPGQGADAEADGGSDALAFPLDLTDPTLDPSLAFIAEDGMETNYFAIECHSVDVEGTLVEEPPLPVGNESSLRCETASIGRLSTQVVLSETNDLFCLIGVLDEFVAEGDDRLEVRIDSSPPGAPWTLVATREGDPIQIAPVMAFGGTTWPFWVRAHYDVISIVPNPQGRLCDEVFGIASN